MTPSLRFLLIAVALLGAVGCGEQINETQIRVMNLGDDAEMTIQFRGGKVTTTRRTAVEAKGSE